MLTPERRRAAVLGAPIGHSLSPALHRAAYAALGLAGWSYDAIECDETGLPGLLGGCGPEWAGLSLTMPLKRAVLPLLDWCEPLALRVGGANTVVFSDSGRRGYNTDVPGMIAALSEAGQSRAEPALILGAGATACAALGALAGLGAAEASAAVRDPSRAALLLAAAERFGLNVRLVRLDQAPPADGGLVISTLPAGAADDWAQRLLGGMPAPRAVFDVVYDRWPTRLAAVAEQAGAVVIGGFELLLQQAARQVELMTWLPAPVAVMRSAGLAERDRRPNAVG